MSKTNQINDRDRLSRFNSFLIGFLLLLSVMSCKDSKRDLDQKDQTIDSLIEKLDSIADTVGHQLKDLNEGVEGGYEKLEDGTVKTDSVL